MEKKSNVIEDEKLKDVLSIEELEQRLEMITDQEAQDVLKNMKACSPALYAPSSCS